MDPTTEMGPLAGEELLKTLDEQVKATLARGAKLLTGGHIIERPVYYYSPTVLTQIPKNSSAYSDELFGPVASLFTVKNAQETIQIRNSLLEESKTLATDANWEFTESGNL